MFFKNRNRSSNPAPVPAPLTATGAGANTGQARQVPSAISQAGLTAFTGELAPAGQVPDLETMSPYNNPADLPVNQYQEPNQEQDQEQE